MGFAPYGVFWSGLFGGAVTVAEALLWIADTVAKLGDLIPQPTVALIVHWLLWIVTVIGVGGAIIILIARIIVKAIKFIQERFADYISLAILLGTLAFNVFFAEVLHKIIDANVLVLFLIANVLGLCIRIYIQSKN